jgi:hypothetical protein
MSKSTISAKSTRRKPGPLKFTEEDWELLWRSVINYPSNKIGGGSIKDLAIRMGFRGGFVAIRGVAPVRRDR